MTQKIAVYGLGRLGYPLFNLLARTGFEVTGVDPKLKDDVPEEPWPTSEPEVAWPEEALERITFSADPVPADMSFIVVPTPSLDKGDHRGGFETTYVEAALRHISKVNGKGHVAVIISTLSPGTVDEISGMPMIRDLRIVYNPTFIAIGTVVHDLVYPDLLLLGHGGNKEAAMRVSAVWDQVFREFHWAGCPYVHYGKYTEVELIKLSVNCFLGTKISLANSLGQLFEAYGIDSSAVKVVGLDHRIGTPYFSPGTPIAGPCLPRDNKALQQAAVQKGINLPISHATDRVNHEMVEVYYRRICGGDHEHVGKRPESVGILGMSYKYGIDITTESAGERIAKRLEASGIKYVKYDDLIAKDTVLEALKCPVVVVTQKEYEPLVSKYKGHVVRIWHD